MPEREVYADLYFFVNAGMDLLCLNLTAALLHCRPRRWRLFLGAAIGGVFSVLILISGLSGVPELLLDALAAFCLCAVAFARRGGSLRRGLATVGAFFVISLLLGGVMTALFWLFNRLHLPVDTLTEDHISVWLFAILALVSGLLTKKGGRLIGRQNKARVVTLEAVLFGKTVRLRALVDTGNLLVDPLSGRPVVLCNPEKLEGVVPAPLLLPPGDPARRQFEEDCAVATRLRLIPSATVAGSALLTAIVPDSLSVVERSGKRRVDDLLAPAPLGDRALGYDALMGA